MGAAAERSLGEWHLLSLGLLWPHAARDLPPAIGRPERSPSPVAGRIRGNGRFLRVWLGLYLLLWERCKLMQQVSFFISLTVD